MTFDEQAVIEYVTQQRWYGAKSRAVAHSQVLDSVELRTTEPHFTLELVEMRYETGAHDIYQLLHGETEIDGLEHPAAARELVHAMRAGLTLQGNEGTIEFRPVEGFAGLGRELLDARPVGAEQSNTSLVFDDELILKVFRRLEPGINPELEMLRFLTEHGFANIAVARRLVRVLGRPAERDARDPAGVRARRRGRLGARARRDRQRAGALPHAAAPPRRSDRRDAHRARAPIRTTRRSAPETPSVESLGLLTATVDEEIESVFLELPDDDERLAPIRGRGEEVREQLRMLTHAGATGKIIRTHGDYHLGQTLWSENDWVILDFEGEPARRARPSAGASARRCATSPGCSARSRTPRARPSS